MTSVELAEVAGASGLAGGVVDELTGEPWLIVGVAGRQVRLFGQADGRPFGSAAEAGRALGMLVARQPHARFVALPLVPLAALAVGSGPCPTGCGAVIGMTDGSCHDPVAGAATVLVGGDQ